MKVALRFTPLHGNYTYIYLEDGKMAKADKSVLKFWKDGDIGQLLQNNKTVFVPYAEEIEVIDFKPIYRTNQNGPSDQHAGSGSPTVVAEVPSSESANEQGV